MHPTFPPHVPTDPPNSHHIPRIPPNQFPTHTTALRSHATFGTGAVVRLGRVVGCGEWGERGDGLASGLGRVLA